MAEHYYIDGYNVLHRSSALKNLARENLENARDRLIDDVAQYCASSGTRATLVFDGRGNQAELQHAPMGASSLEIVYASARQSADAYIERAVYVHPHRRDAIVVSGDRGITDLCIGLGALAMTPDTFLTTIRDETQRVRSKVEREQPNSSVMSRVEDALDDDAKDRLAQLRNRLEKNDET